jgi:hypothetical protein
MPDDVDQSDVYAAVAARRLQWDLLVWQVPVLCLTAQAFLYSIELGSSTSPVARIIAALASLVMTFLCVTLMARHRQAELFDAHWLGKVEETALGPDGVAHGRAFARARNQEPVEGGWTERVVPMLGGYKTWIAGLLLLGLGSVAVLVLSIVNPAVLRG